MNTSGSSGTHTPDTFDPSNSAEQRSFGAQQTDKAAKNLGPDQARMTSPASAGVPISEEAGAQGTGTETVMIEVLTEETGPGFGFQWWYVPAIAVPIAAAAGATVTALIMRRRRQDMKAAQLAAAARTWVDALRLRRAVDQANMVLEQGRHWGRQTSQLTPKQLNAWRALLNQQVSQWRTQVPGQVNAWRDLATQQASQWRDAARSSAQPVVKSARSKALASRNSATQAFSGASQTVNASVSHTLAFGLGAVVSAMLTYVGLWRQRMTNAELEATNSRTGAMHEEPIL